MSARVLGRFSVLDHGFAELLDVMPSCPPTWSCVCDRSELSEAEYAVLTAARTSTGGEAKGYETDLRLLTYLLRNRHSTPFEMVEFKFRLQMPISVCRQHIRHRTANVNEYSTRYAEAIDHVYVPPIFNGQGSMNKQGSIGPLISWPEGSHIIHDASPECLDDQRDTCILPTGEVLSLMNPAETVQEYIQRTRLATIGVSKDQYETELALGVSREVARGNIPVDNYTLLVWKIDLWNLLHYFGLRLDHHAQGEIRTYAKAMWDLVYPYVPHILDLFEDIRINGLHLSGSDCAAISGFLAGVNALPRKLIDPMGRLGYSLSDLETVGLGVQQK